MEKWLPTREFSNYEVSDKGNIRNIKTGKILKPYTSNQGHKQVSLYENGVKYVRKLSRLVAELFCEGAREGLDVIHRDGDKGNIAPTNLKWCNRSENMLRAYQAGRKQTHLMKKVRVVETGKVYESETECSKATGINITTISKCLNNPALASREGYHFEPAE